MIEKPMDVLQRFPVRKSKKQKQNFRDEIQSYVRSLGYECTVEKGGFGSRNVVIGDPEKAKYLVTAHYDTCAGMFLPNMVFPRNPVAFILYQLLVVAIVIAISSVAGVGLTLITKDSFLGVVFSMVVYFALLIGMMVGPANRHNANDNTSGVVTVLEMAASMPPNLRKRVCFVLFDLEEAGLLGSSAHRKAHKSASNRQIVLNMDCVGDGDEIWLLPNGKVRKDAAKMEKLCALEASCGEKSIHVHQKGYAFYPSDQANFPYGVAIGAFHRNKWMGLYYSRIHTNRDTILEHTNVNILRACLTSLIGSDAAE